MKTSRIKRLIPKKLERELSRASGDDRARLEAAADREAADTIASMRKKGYRLVTRLENGEGVFVRDNGVVALHVQIPEPLYRKLERVCEQREVSKKQIVVEALERWLARE